MPRFIIKITHQQNMLYELVKEEATIGRGDESDLVLPNVSVSRAHARVLRGAQGVNIEDLDSQNGIVVNGEKVEQHSLCSGDMVEIGRFTLIYLTDRPEDRFWRGRAVSYIPRYDKKNISTHGEDSTHLLSPEIAARLQRDNQLLHSACITLNKSSLYWFPEGHSLTFGDSRASVLVEGFLVRGTVATVTWDGRVHRFQRTSSMVTAVHNGRKLRNKEETPLRPGDRFEVAGSLFKYDLRLEGAAG
jgi:pSer/pThr/pTyr-binding forkhead associated (FHA) protein